MSYYISIVYNMYIVLGTLSSFLMLTQYKILDLTLSLELFFNLTKYCNSFDTKAILCCRLLDNFSNHIFFYPCNYSSLYNCTAYLESCHMLCPSAQKIHPCSDITFPNIQAHLPQQLSYLQHTSQQ